jgi:Secretion system C-terminal sorting domain
MKKSIVSVLFCFSAFFCNAAVWFASATGSVSGNGSINAPWDLQTALSQPAVMVAGDTLLLRGGVYTGNFVSTLTGLPGFPIVVMSYPGEHATIADNRQYAAGATLQVNGAWTYYQDLEITNTAPVRTSTSSASFRPMGIQAQGANCKFIHIVIHDTGHGFGFWKEAIDAEIYGCIIYNCGTENSIGNYITHGHGIYSQNNNGLKIISDNIIFNQFGFGIHLYPNPGNISGYQLTGNVLFHNGILTDSSFRLNNILVETYSPFQASNITIHHNFTYDDVVNYPHTSVYDFDVLAGSVSANSGRIDIDSNYFAGNGRAGLALLNWDTAHVKYNRTFYREGSAAVAFGGSGAGYDWNFNQYSGTQPGGQFAWQSNSPTTFANWQLQSGFDAASTYTNSFPTTADIFWRPDQYTPGRSLLLVYNWGQQAGVTVSPPGLVTGDLFEIIDVQNYFGAPVYSGIYNAASPAIYLSLTATQTSSPIGWWPAPHTGTMFNCFIVRRVQPVVGTAELLAGSVTVYPQPAKGVLYAEFWQPQNEAVIELYDLAGRPVALKQHIEADTTPISLNIEHLASGSYVLLIRTAAGVMHKKIIIEQ